jgi:hypothetical protein
VPVQRGLEFDNSKQRFESGIFNCIYWLYGSFFGDDDRSFLKERVKKYLMESMSPLDSRTSFLYSHL